MTSIIRTLTISLSLAATAIFLVMLSIVIWLSQKREGDHMICQAAAAILSDATLVDPGHAPTVRSTRYVEEFKSNNPDLWYVVSDAGLTTEFGSERRPALPIRLPYSGPIGLSVVIGSAELIRIFFTCMGDRIGCSDFISAAAPVTIGADAEVPQNVHQLELTTGAQTSPGAARLIGLPLGDSIERPEQSVSNLLSLRSVPATVITFGIHPRFPGV